MVSSKLTESPSKATENSTPQPSISSFMRSSSDRLSLPYPFRLPLGMTAAGLAGFVLGVSHGSSEAALRFRAENAHRFPTTQTGWYLYHKSKNYNVALEGIFEGFRMGFKQAFWVALFISMEECVDRGRTGLVRQWKMFKGRPYDVEVVASRDFVSSVLAGLGTAGAFSVYNRFPVYTTTRMAKMGAKAGLVFGVVQDLLSMLRGRHLGYVDFVKRHTFGTSEHDVVK
ncbi:Hypothetical protein R9X50_00455600 [Acrodontium crateriforme]|uniref:Uncharacterized protein n=1 Tax=Acrodontium crateriforme TaxID=150365 RepID=A0AAQ3M5K5_9PEZI|nr:Hypothetical protein R9X50_00455600 [Acrodontium crateriforme]